MLSMWIGIKCIYKNEWGKYEWLVWKYTKNILETSEKHVCALTDGYILSVQPACF
jgi:hypothetical protein